MKTFIIQLEAHDDIASARDKLKGAKARRAIFVWPKTGRSLADFYSLSLLQREAQRLGVSIGFITQNEEARENARVLQIPLFDSLSQAERSTLRAPVERKIERRAPVGYQNLVDTRDRIHPIRRSTRLHEFGQAAVFLVSILSLISLVLFFIPSARIRITPHKTKQSVEFDVRVNPDAKEVNLAGVIPGKTVNLELSSSKTAVSTGHVQVGQNYASGALILTNQSGSSVNLPKGTLFFSTADANLTFLTMDDVHLPADGGQGVQVQVTANQAGTTANLPAGETFQAQLAWPASITATNPEAFKGGTTIDSPAPTDEDVAAARQALMKELKQQAGDMFLTGRPQGTILIPQSLGGSVISEVRSAEEGQPADHFTIEIKMAFSAITYLQQDVNELGQSILDANLGSQMTQVTNTLNVIPSSDYFDQRGTYSWKVSAKRLIMEQQSLDALSEQLVRMPVDQAQRFLDTHLKLDQASEITLSPTWWKRMPFASFRINFEEQ